MEKYTLNKIFKLFPPPDCNTCLPPACAAVTADRQAGAGLTTVPCERLPIGLTERVRWIYLHAKKMILPLFLVLPLLFPVLAPASPASAKKERYKIMGDIREAGRIRPIEVVEYFNFSCRHCYRFFQDRGRERLLRRFGDAIRVKQIPIYWGKQTPFPAMAYYLAEKHGKALEINEAIFDANFTHDLDIFDVAVLNRILLDHGLPTRIDGREWSKSLELKDRVKEGLKMADRFDVHETPSIVLNKVVKVMPEHTNRDMMKMIHRVEEAIIDLSRLNPPGSHE